MSDTADRIASQIREFSETVEHPDRWRVSIPDNIWDAVKERLDTEDNRGTYFDGVDLCYTEYHDEPKVEYHAGLDAHLETVETGEDDVVDATEVSEEEAIEDLGGGASTAEIDEDDLFTDGGTVKDDPEEALPGLPRERSVPSRGDVPSTGFITPHQRNRFETIKNLTDEHTAVRLYGLVMGGEYANFEKALKAAIGWLHKRKQTSKSGVRWRYYCADCEFIGAASPTYWNAEWGSSRHDSAVGSCDSTVFAYYTDDWDPEDVEALVERYHQEIDGETQEVRRNDAE